MNLMKITLGSISWLLYLGLNHVESKRCVKIDSINVLGGWLCTWVCGRYTNPGRYYFYRCNSQLQLRLHRQYPTWIVAWKLEAPDVAEAQEVPKQ